MLYGLDSKNKQTNKAVVDFPPWLILGVLKTALCTICFSHREERKNLCDEGSALAHSGREHSLSCQAVSVACDSGLLEALSGDHSLEPYLGFKPVIEAPKLSTTFQNNASQLGPSYTDTWPRGRRTHVL